MDHDAVPRRHKLGVRDGVYVPVCLNIVSILMFLRFGLVLGSVGLWGFLGLLVISYVIDFVTALSLSAVASNGEVKGGGAYYLISRSLGPEFGGSIGILFYLSQAINSALNVVGLIDCLRLNLRSVIPAGFWWGYLFETIALVVCTAVCLGGSTIFARANNGLLAVLSVAILSIPVSALFLPPFKDDDLGVHFTGVSWATLVSNLWPRDSARLHTFRGLFGVLFSATSGIFAGASMSGDLRNPSKSIPRGTLWAMLTTFIVYLVVILSMASTITHRSLLSNDNVIQEASLWPPIILAGECAVTFFSSCMGLIGAAKLMQALARDELLPGLPVFGRGDEPVSAILLTYLIAQVALLGDLNQIATLISMGYMMTFLVMNLACFFLKVGSAPNFRPAFKWFSWHTALLGSFMSIAAMIFIDEAYATTSMCLLLLLFLLIHYLSPRKDWGDVGQNLIYHQVRKYLLRLKPEHIKFWRPQIILLINDPRRQSRLISFCNSLKKGGLYIVGHCIVTDDFHTGVHEAKLQQAAWTNYITEYSRIKAFVQLTMSPSIIWGIRNLILSSGLGGLRPNIAIMGFYDLDGFRSRHPSLQLGELPPSTTSSISGMMRPLQTERESLQTEAAAHLLASDLPTDVIRNEEPMRITEYLTILEDLALRYRLNVAVGKGFHALETPLKNGRNTKKYIDCWPIQVSAELEAEGKNVLTTNFDTYTLILQLGWILHTVPAWKRVYQLRVMVFVEYEHEIKQERGRVKALLEKLRIEAEVHVFWLANGRLATYETIIRGYFDPGPMEDVTWVQNVLRDGASFRDKEWWSDLQGSRARKLSSEFSQDLAFSEEDNTRTASLRSRPDRQDSVKRRPSLALVGELPRKPTVSTLSRLGFNMGIHTHSLPRKVFDFGSDDDEVVNSSDSGSEGSNLDADFNDAASDGAMEDNEPRQRPVVDFTNRRRSHGDALVKRPSWGQRNAETGSRSLLDSSSKTAYGTMTTAAQTSTRAAGEEATGRKQQQDAEDQELEAQTVQPRTKIQPQFLLPVRPLIHGSEAVGISGSDAATKQSSIGIRRPGLSRTTSSSLRFTSNVVPETKITDPGGTGPKISFADTVEASSSRPERPRASRRGTATDEKAAGRKVSFAQQEPDPPIPPLVDVDEPNDARIDIPELLSRYSFSSRGTGGSSGADENISPSFNELPSRAQHLILNELMRKNSEDTAVLLTTLPIPEEGTCDTEEASMQYLSDVEVLCHELPPTLMVLSNNMTVTVSI